MLPYLDEQKLFERYDFEQPWDSAANLQLASEMPPVYAFHGEMKPGNVTTNYLAVVGAQTVWPGASPRTSERVTDELSSTIMIVENTGQGIHWMEPRDLQFDSMNWTVNDPAGVSSKYDKAAVVMLDGSLRKLEPTLTKEILQALLTVSGGEQLESTGEGWRFLSDGRMRTNRSALESNPHQP